MLHSAYIGGEDLLKQFTEDTIVAVVNGGETIWITADFVESHQTTYIKQLPMCPMSHKSEVIRVNIVNIGWIKDVDRIVRENVGNSDTTMEEIKKSKMTVQALHMCSRI